MQASRKQSTFKPSFTVSCALLTFTLLLLCVVLVLILYSKPIADDFYSLAYIPKHTFISYVYSIYIHQNGRFSNAVLMVAGIKLLSTKAIVVVPLIEVLGLGIFSAAILSKIDSNRLTKKLYYILGFLFAGVSILVVPSVFDTISWYTSSTVYIAAIDFILLDFYLLLKLRADEGSRVMLSLLCISVIITQGFYEVTAIIVLLLCCAILLRSVKKKKNIYQNLMVCFSSLLGILIVYFSPGTHHREAAQKAHLSIYQMIVGGLRDFIFLKNTLFSWRILYILVFALAVSSLIRLKIDKNQQRNMLVFGLFLCLFPFFLSGAATTYANEGGISPTRTAAVAVIAFVVGFSLLTMATVSARPNIHKYLSPILIILILASATFSFAGVTTIINAEKLRYNLVNQRKISIKKQLTQHSKLIYVTPAPILLSNSQATDLSYKKDHEIGWVVKAFEKDERISRKKIIIVSKPPRYYCLTSSSNPWFGAYTCSQNKIVYGS